LRSPNRPCIAAASPRWEESYQGNEQCAVQGEVEERLYSPEGVLLRHSHGTTVCLGIEPNGSTARIAAKIDRTEPPIVQPPPPAEPIEYGILKVIDNGEGANDPPDEGGAVRGATRTTAFFHCACGVLPYPTTPSIRGNVQVRP